jgi:hypothetical protein
MTASFNNVIKILNNINPYILFAENILNFIHVSFSYITSCLAFGYRISLFELINFLFTLRIMSSICYK